MFFAGALLKTNEIQRFPARMWARMRAPWTSEIPKNGILRSREQKMECEFPNRFGNPLTLLKDEYRWEERRLREQAYDEWKDYWRGISASRCNQQGLYE